MRALVVDGAAAVCEAPAVGVADQLESALIRERVHQVEDSGADLLGGGEHENGSATCAGGLVEVLRTAVHTACTVSVDGHSVLAHRLHGEGDRSSGHAWPFSQRCSLSCT